MAGRIAVKVSTPRSEGNGKKEDTPSVPGSAWDRTACEALPRALPRPEETVDVLAAYLVEARQTGLREVRIVHGRGRGVQRAAIRRALADAPGVAEFTDAPPGRGGWGATIVRLHPLGGEPAT